MSRNTRDRTLLRHQQYVDGLSIDVLGARGRALVSGRFLLQLPAGTEVALPPVRS